MTKRRWAVMLGIATLGALVVSALIWGKEPGPRSSGDPEDADYCNVLLIPSIAERIDLDRPMRLRVATKGARLLHEFRNGSGQNPVMRSAGSAADEAGTAMVEQSGWETREMIPILARIEFDRLFEDGQLARVRFKTEKSTEVFGGSDRYLMTYGWYEQERRRSP